MERRGVPDEPRRRLDPQTAESLVTAVSIEKSIAPLRRFGRRADALRLLQRAELDYLVSSRTASTAMADSYVGLPFATRRRAAGCPPASAPALVCMRSRGDSWKCRFTVVFVDRCVQRDGIDVSEYRANPQMTRLQRTR